ncbi:LysR family transcriptional regulator [Kiloniella laminariae]|uniref:LysR family transcriptional regulator n=1 Tax=Kiloniella laminariae TaxID=454162 RepID=A0ABT4LP35_9PROT|nr:LysR family transcriptional regulator [Kiloniella laminariae]MCZ4282883.1 LysR family transcriptional regulator [Kiloniella laminariae]
MSTPDFNLLVTLDVLLAEGSVAKAAQRLRLSPSAMSRALARLRETTGDPLLVRAGRGLVPTPRALELRERVAHLVQDGKSVLRPVEKLNLEQLKRTFVLRVSEGFVENFGPDLIARVFAEAPKVQLRFIHKLNRESTELRDGTVDLEIGVVGEMTSPEVRIGALYRDRLVGVVRCGHLLSRGQVTLSGYATGRHVCISRNAGGKGRVEKALKSQGVERNIVAFVPGFSTALSLVRQSDLIATVPERHTGNLRKDLYSFPLPFSLSEVMVSMLWHPRLEASPADRWLRDCVRDVCGKLS